MKQTITLWRLLSIVAVVLLSFGFVACSSDDDDDDPTPEPAPVTTLSVTPDTVVTLAYSTAFNLSISSDVSFYYVEVLPKSQVDILTDEELVDTLSKDRSDRNSAGDSYIHTAYLASQTQYVICALGYDRSGNHGQVSKTDILTKSATNQPLAEISDGGYNDNYWFWTTTTNGFVTRYYQYGITRYDLYSAPDAAVAWFFQKDMWQNPDNFQAYAQGDSWQRLRNGATFFHEATWAVGVDGQFSGVIDRYRFNLSSSAKENVTDGSRSRVIGKVYKYLE